MTDAAQTVMEKLGRASEGLYFPSETDAPLTPFFWPSHAAGKPTPALLAEHAGVAPDAKVKSVSVAAFFRPVTREEEWHNEQERAEAARFRQLMALIKAELDGATVFRVGSTSVAIYIMGRVEGGYAGLVTRVVET